MPNDVEELDSKAYREKTAQASKQFWTEVDEYCEAYNISEVDAQLAVRIMCGDAPWDAWKQLHPEWEAEKLSTVQCKVKADAVYKRDDMREFVRWAKARSIELCALDLSTWDWSFKDSEMALRLLIACGEEQMIALDGLVLPSVSTAIINAVRELNKMHDIGTANTYADKARAVIFLNEDSLED